MGDGGVPLVLVPGFGGDINIFVFNQEALSEDGAVYALDLPGHGASSKDVGDGDLDFFVGVIAGFLDEMGVERSTSRATRWAAPSPAPSRWRTRIGRLRWSFWPAWGSGRK